MATLFFSIARIKLDWSTQCGLQTFLCEQISDVSSSTINAIHPRASSSSSIDQGPFWSGELVVSICMAMHALHFVALLLILIQGFELGIFFAGLIGFLEMPLLHACIFRLKLPFSPDLHQQGQTWHSREGFCRKAVLGFCNTAWLLVLSQGSLMGRARVQTAPPWSLRWLQAGRPQGCQWTSCARLPHAFSRPQPCGSCLWNAHHLQMCGGGLKSQALS